MGSEFSRRLAVRITHHPECFYTPRAFPGREKCLRRRCCSLKAGRCGDTEAPVPDRAETAAETSKAEAAVSIPPTSSILRTGCDVYLQPTLAVGAQIVRKLTRPATHRRSNGVWNLLWRNRWASLIPCRLASRSTSTGQTRNINNFSTIR